MRDTDGPERIAIFPLEQVVLFPRLLTPLHLFEPRYRQMAADALAGDRRIAMVTVRADHAHEMQDEPPVYAVGCAGVITEAQKLPDGRYNIVLLGTDRVRILDEPPRGPDVLYRIASVERLPDCCDPGDSEAVPSLRARVIEGVAGLVRCTEPERAAEITPAAFRDVDDAALANSLAKALPFGTAEKQGLLEADSIRERLERLEALLTFQRAERDALKVPNSGTLH